MDAPRSILNYNAAALVKVGPVKKKPYLVFKQHDWKKWGAGESIIVTTYIVYIGQWRGDSLGIIKPRANLTIKKYVINLISNKKIQRIVRDERCK